MRALAETGRQWVLPRTPRCWISNRYQHDIAGAISNDLVGDTQAVALGIMGTRNHRPSHAGRRAYHRDRNALFGSVGFHF